MKSSGLVSWSRWSRSYRLIKYMGVTEENTQRKICQVELREVFTHKLWASDFSVRVLSFTNAGTLLALKTSGQ